MTTPIDVTAKIVGAAEVEARFLTSRQGVTDRVRDEILSLAIQLQRRVKSTKLSGQVLHVVTGRLRRSINVKVRTEGAEVTGSVGTNVDYGAFWELGFEVKEHERSVRFRIGKDGTSRFAKLKRANFEQVVKFKARTVGARPFLRPSLDEMRPVIQLRLARAAFLGIAS